MLPQSSLPAASPHYSNMSTHAGNAMIMWRKLNFSDQLMMEYLNVLKNNTECTLKSDYSKKEQENPCRNPFGFKVETL